MGAKTAGLKYKGMIKIKKFKNICKIFAPRPSKVYHRMVYDVQSEFIMSNLNRKITGLAAATLLATGLSACKEEKMQAQPLAQGYQNADTAQPAVAQPNQAVVSDTKTAEGKCGEGKCGEAGCSATMGDNKSASASCGASTANADKSASAACGASTDKNANASCGGSK
ncbi:hypothetical protein A9Z60_05925 [Moraxella nonliquefaciens]|uniref:Uncharacterized protein n=3 Tax=Moraxella nonliquefaciens TaxID=478 RepID=A0A1B8PLF2_MORNO|nr:hypothetical protein A9Z60_05925 [Moraxella nonliquefaciens]